MNILELFRQKSPVLSFEFFPPKDAASADLLREVVGELAGLRPDCITFGAGGPGGDRIFEGAREMMQSIPCPVVAYLSGYGLGPDEIRRVMDRCLAMGVENVFVIRGDRPKEAGFRPHPESFEYASDLIAFVKRHYPFVLGCGGYPEGHVDAPDLEQDLQNLKRKVEAGADYIITQYFHDNAFFFSYVERCRALGIQVPILPGVMPVYTVKLTQSLSRICGARITPALQSRLDAVDPRDSQAVLDLGVDFATEQCRGLLRQGVAGLHLYTMNRRSSTIRIVQRLREEGLLA
nr:methylenetetrahydrofolate reductase [uncultured Holophaga sp.]